jgi:glycosyltransferase A (GT-A) superfamily protein (DUF2064 family)
MAKTLTVYLAADLKKFNSGMDQAGKKVNGFSGSLKNKLGPALIAAGAAAGAFALKLAKDGVQAAIEDEKAVAQLANTLTNLNLAHDTQAVEDYIYQLERAYGVADTELRPAYERLVRSTQDTEEANRALQIAMDVAAGTGQSLKTVTDSLGRAFDGQTSTLARLGTGIDKTTLATASMDDILNQLSANFSGAADAAANTFEGRMDRLKTATDNLAEAFGAGLLDSLNDATEGTQNAVDAMEDLEPLLKGIGKAVGDNVADIAYLAGVMTDLADGADSVAKNLGPLEYAWDSFVSNLGTGTIGLAADAIRELRGETNRLVGLIGGGDFDSAYEDSNFQIQAANSIYRDAAVRIDRINTELEEQAAQKERETKLYKGGAGAVEQYTKEQQKLLDTSELLGISLATTRDELIGSIGDLEAATAAVEAYANSIQQDLLGGINLGQLYQDNFDEQGRQTGKSLIDGFQEQVNQAEWFGNVLTAIKAQGADQSLIEQIASLGPEVGGALGQQLLNEGIVPTLNEQWVNVQDTTKELALGLVPEFLEAGRLSAIENLNGLAEQFKKDQRKFKKLGRAIGEQVGASFKKQIAKDVRDAVRAVEAAATAARAERVAAAEAEQARITEQAVATAISNLIRNSDQRSGRNVQPVLQ